MDKSLSSGYASKNKTYDIDLFLEHTSRTQAAPGSVKQEGDIGDRVRNSLAMRMPWFSTIAEWQMFRSDSSLEKSEPISSII